MYESCVFLHFKNIHFRPLICGGQDDQGKVSRDCKEYSFDLGSWINSSHTLLEPRMGAAAVVLKTNGSLFVIGGEKSSTKPLRSTETTTTDKGFSYGPEMPQALVQVCACNTMEGHVFISGGKVRERLEFSMFSFKLFPHQGSGAVSSTYAIDPSSSIWRSLPRMNHRRYAHSCGLIGDGDRIIVAGGYNSGEILKSAEIFSLSDSKWSMGERTCNDARIAICILQTSHFCNRRESSQAAEPGISPPVSRHPAHIWRLQHEGIL